MTSFTVSRGSVALVAQIEFPHQVSAIVHLNAMPDPFHLHPFSGQCPDDFPSPSFHKQLPLRRDLSQLRSWFVFPSGPLRFVPARQG